MRRICVITWSVLGIVGAIGAPRCWAQGGVPSIAITSLPPYGTSGNLTGTVSGVANPGSYGVAIYIHIDGLGWWIKPFASSLVSVSASGVFSAPVVSGGLDNLATIFSVTLLPPGFPAGTLPTNSETLPTFASSLARATANRYGPTLNFAGRTWAVKEAPLPVGPGNNRFSANPNDVWVDPQGRLHLTVHLVGGLWRSTEVILLESLGHGTYWFTTESQVGQLDANLVFGAYTWNSFGNGPAPTTYSEIDFEDSRWGNPTDPTSSQVVVQPYSTPGNLLRYTTPVLLPSPTLTRFFEWTPGRVRFVAAQGLHSPCSVTPASMLHQSLYLTNASPGHAVPTAGLEQFRFNLWSSSPSGPMNGQSAEVIISDFRFSSIVGVFRGGCGLNPVGSLSASGSASVTGTGLTLGISNPLATQSPGSLASLAISALPSPGFPCGASLPSFGMTGGPGELLLSLAPFPFIWTSPTPWNGPGQPVLFPITLPPSLVGVIAYAQGILADPSPTASIPFGLTDALEVCISP